jgi:hypothetical protein
VRPGGGIEVRLLWVPAGVPPYANAQSDASRPVSPATPAAMAGAGARRAPAREAAGAASEGG